MWACSRQVNASINGAALYATGALCLTGWTQINGRDELPIPQKVELDVDYLQRQSLWFDIKIIWLTFVKVVKKEGVSH